MAGTRKVKRKVGELRDVDVVRLSLVDRGAIRVPFRRMKQEGSGVLNFKGLFKDEPVTIGLAAVAVAKGAAEGTEDEVKAAGFSTATKAEDRGNVVYLQVPQAEFDLDACQRVKVGEGVHVLVTGAEELLEKAAEAFGLEGDERWIPGMVAATDALQARLDGAVEKGEGIPAEVAAAVDDFKAYAACVSALPAPVLKLELQLATKADEPAAEPTEAKPAETEPAKPAEPVKSEPAAEPAAKADEPAESAKPEPAPADQAGIVAAVVAALEPKLQAIKVEVEAAKASAEEARELASKRTASLPAPAGDPEPLTLRGRVASKSEPIPLMDTARERPAD